MKYILISEHALNERISIWSCACNTEVVMWILGKEYSHELTMVLPVIEKTCGWCCWPIFVLLKWVPFVKFMKQIMKWCMWASVLKMQSTLSVYLIHQRFPGQTRKNDFVHPLGGQVFSYGADALFHHLLIIWRRFPWSIISRLLILVYLQSSDVLTWHFVLCENLGIEKCIDTWKFQFDLINPHFFNQYIVYWLCVLFEYLQKFVLKPYYLKREKQKALENMEKTSTPVWLSMSAKYLCNLMGPSFVLCCNSWWDAEDTCCTLF